MQEAGKELSIGMTMRMPMPRHRMIPFALAMMMLTMLADSAWAFRCGSRIVKDGMHESEVIRLCGEPVSTRHLGFVVRSFGVGDGRLVSTPRGTVRRQAWYQQEVEVTESVFNFGPRKLMRRLRFEGGILVSISTMGYGYHE